MDLAEMFQCGPKFTHWHNRRELLLISLMRDKLRLPARRHLYIRERLAAKDGCVTGNKVINGGRRAGLP